MGQQAPHSPKGNCLDCHTFITPPKNQIARIGLFQPEAPGTSSKNIIGPRSDFMPSGAQSEAHRDWSVIARSAAFVLAAAVVFNMIGLGGGFFYVPILLLFGVGFHTASATSLFIITVAHMSALYVFLRSGLIDFKLAMVLEPLTMIGAFLGGVSSKLLGETTLSVMFGLVLMGASYLMHQDPMKGRPFGFASSPRWSWQRSFGSYEYAIDLSIGLPIAFSIGYFGGMLGFAGGILKVPMLVILFGVPIKVAIATSSLMVAITSLVGCVGHGMVGHFDFRIAIALSLMAVAGAQIGARFAIKADKETLKRLMAFVLLVMAIWMIGRVV